MLGIQYIDVSEVAEEFYLTKNEIDSFVQFILKSVTNRFKNELEKQAGEKLHQTRNEYIRSIEVKSVNDNTTEVSIVGFMPNAVEQGISPFDEKIGFLKSSKVTPTKDGKGFYITIPFRFKSSTDVIGDSQSFSSAALCNSHRKLFAINRKPGVLSTCAKGQPIPLRQRCRPYLHG